MPEERDAFDADCRHALGQAAAESGLEPVRSVIEQWWRIATVTRHDPAAHRRMLGRIDQTHHRPDTRMAAHLGRTADGARRPIGDHQIQLPDEVWGQIHALPAETDEPLSEAMTLLTHEPGTASPTTAPTPPAPYANSSTGTATASSSTSSSNNKNATSTNRQAA
ncbi:DUF6247 family protein [Actinosynnema sp. NPDC059335]|uniref:DUF6247 family protein n=1 Tax=Actinosynnema sp. NPDC059335 TaxID=3346804 RepID=UPI003670B371